MSSTTLTGPAGGEWVRVTARGRDVPSRCDQCGSLVGESWKYYVGAMCHACVCLTCADPTTEEVTMQGVTPEILTEVALALEAAHLDWEQGKAASPDTRDYVLITERILEERLGPEYLWLNDEGTTLAGAITTRESVAEDLYEAQCAGKLGEWREMAEWLVGCVTVGPDADDYPSGERS